MKKTPPVEPAKRILPTLYGAESGGVYLSDLCAPMVGLDFNSGGFECKADSYYNPWPSPIRDKHKWIQFERGIHTTSDLGDIEKLLSEKDANRRTIIAKRAVDKLVSLGYTVELSRIRTVTTTHRLELTITRCPERYIDIKIISDKHEINTQQNGDWET